jgi:DNA modification methylase
MEIKKLTNHISQDGGNYQKNLIDVGGSRLSAQPFKGEVFVCTEETEEDSFKYRLFGTNRVHAPAMMKVKKGDFLFLLNLHSDLLHGVFRASSDAQMNIEREAWNGKYPYQIRVEPLGDIVSIKNARSLLKKLGIKHATPMVKNSLIRLLELYRPKEFAASEWVDFLIGSQTKSTEMKPRELKEWTLLGKVEEIKESKEEIPQLEATTLWDFPKQSYGKTPKGNNKYPGVTPAQLIWNLIWRYTEPGDLVVDPMCGSGTTIDVCREEGRRVIGYDIAPVRPDIIQNDARKIPLPEDSVDLVFVDSPYGDNIRYNDHPDCIGKVSSETEQFYDELEKVIKECNRVLKKGKALGWLIGDQWVKKKFTPVGFKLYQRLSKYFETIDIICITRRGQASHTGLWYNRARRFNFFLRGFKYLFIMRKPEGQVKEIEPREINWTYYERQKDTISTAMNRGKERHE